MTEKALPVSNIAASCNSPSGRPDSSRAIPCVVDSAVTPPSSSIAELTVVRCALACRTRIGREARPGRGAWPAGVRLRSRSGRAPTRPLALAKEMASVDVASNSRLIFGVGAGYLRPEFDALHARFDNRGKRLENALAAMKAIWEMDEPVHEGQFWSFEGIQSRPQPVTSVRKWRS